MPIFVITPLIGWSLPALTPLILAAGAAYGYKRLTGRGENDWLMGRLTREMETMRKVSLPLDEVVTDVVGEEVGRDERLVFEKDALRLIFRRNARGKFFVDVLGPRNRTERSLQKEARQFADELVRQFVYSRVVTEMEERGLNVVAEQVEEESGDIILDLRRWR